MIQKFLLPILLGFIIMTSCKARPLNQTLPSPYETLRGYTDGVVTNWLDVRMDSISYAIFTRPLNSWKQAQSIDELSQWFNDNLGPVSGVALWDFRELIESIRQTYHYQENIPLEGQFLDVLKNSLSKYYFEE